LSDDDAEVRASAVKALSKIDDPRRIKGIIGALNDQSREVRIMAAFSLKPEKDPMVIEAFVSALNDKAADVRIIAATNKDLHEEIEKGNFREDLYFRLNVIPLTVPPLRERKADIPLLVTHFLKSFAQQYGQKPKKMSKATLRSLIEYDWPGNVRELKNSIERFVIMNPTDTIDVKESLSFKGSRTDYSAYKTLREAREQFEKDFIVKKLQENNWNISKTAEDLEIERSNLHRKIKSLGIETSA